jgi:hypothetical protein
MLLHPILFMYFNLRVHIALLSYSLIVLTTVVLYLLACDPLPPAREKSVIGFKDRAPSQVAASESLE